MAHVDRLQHAREVFHAWMRQWNYLADGAPDDREIDAFLMLIIDGPEDVLDGRQEADTLQIGENSSSQIH